MYSSRLYSPLRYPGGKAKFAPFIAELMSINGLRNGHYLEPFAGGAGVALDLLFHGYASHIHINDIDPAIYSFWFSAKNYSNELIDLVDKTPVTIDEWHKWKSVLQDDQISCCVKKGFATLFLNRTNRSGILKAGVIGGKQQNGKDKIDARFNKENIISRLKKIHDFSSGISVYCRDTFDLLNSVDSLVPENTLVYLDPPYYIKGKGLYRNYYEHKDHLVISELLQSSSFKWPWVVSYDNTQEIKDMYDESVSLEYGLNYSAHKQYLGNEIMFFSNNLCVPKQHASMKIG